MADRRNDDEGSKRSSYLVAVSRETRRADKQFASAAARNSAPIIDVLREVAPKRGRALEIASGTGQHITAFAAAFPGVDWQPSDPDASARASVAAWVAGEGLENVAEPLALDAAAEWETSVAPGLDLIVCINMIHIAPWDACRGLLRGAAALLAAGGLLYLYGPYKRDGRRTAPSNEAFDRSLRARNAQWGVRDLREVRRLAEEFGFRLDRTVDMPANNLSVIFRLTD